jgi:CubicO group peptidase (beta-lactamase class C family)
MHRWLTVIIAGVGLLLIVILGLYGYLIATMPALHPNAQDLPSVTRSAPLPKWVGAVEEARKVVRASLSEKNLPGFSVAVGTGGDVVWAEGFGWADLEDRVPVTPDTPFRIGTASTALTSAAVGLLLEKDRLKLDEEIQTYVPAFPQKQWPITLRQLMGHVAGVRNDAGDEERLTEHCDRTVDGLQRFAELPLRFEPGTRYRYSTYGWIVISAAVEAAAGQPFFAFMRKQIFEPLAMDHTSADAETEPARDRAVFYFPRFAADPRYGPQEPSEVDYSCFAGSSAFLSTPSDLVRFVMAINSGKLLQPATVQLLQTPQRLASGEETGYGLGWDLKTVTLAGEHSRVVGHDGKLMGGMVASFMTFPKHGLVVSVTSNMSFADTFSVATRVAEAFVQQDRSPARK